MHYALCCIALSGLWSVAAMANGASGRITFVGAVMPPTCNVTTMVVLPASAIVHASDARDVRVCGQMHQGRFARSASYRVAATTVPARRWLPTAAILRLLGQPVPGRNARIKLETRSYR